MRPRLIAEPFSQLSAGSAEMFPIRRTGAKLDGRTGARQADSLLPGPQLKGDRSGATAPLNIGYHSLQPSVAEQRELIAAPYTEDPLLAHDIEEIVELPGAWVFDAWISDGSAKDAAL
jgi:hypothetical protein